MADRMKDDEDLKLEAVFRAEPIDDGGFSARVTRRIRRRIWVRRMALPVAVLIGGSIAAKPFIEVLGLLPTLLSFLPEDVRTAPMELLPQTPILVAGAMLAASLLFVRFLEE